MTPCLVWLRSVFQLLCRFPLNKQFDVSFLFGSEMKFKVKQVRKYSMDTPEIHWQNPNLTLLPGGNKKVT